jgi:hypothetical protein
MNIFKNFYRGISTLLTITIIVALIIVIVGGILVYQRYLISSPETQNPVTEKPKPEEFLGTSETDTANWKFFVDEKVGYSLKYPPELKEKQVDISGLRVNIASIIFPVVLAANSPLDKWDFESDFLTLSISRQKVSDVKDELPPWPPGNTKEVMEQDEESLKNGQFGHSYGFVLEESQKVVKIDDEINGKEFISLGMFEICDVSPIRFLIFFRNGYEVTVGLYAGPALISEIKSQLPEYFEINQNNCGEEPIWKFENGDGQLQFYNDLVNGVIGSETAARFWYDTFDEIISTIDLSEVSPEG